MQKKIADLKNIWLVGLTMRTEGEGECNLKRQRLAHLQNYLKKSRQGPLISVPNSKEEELHFLLTFHFESDKQKQTYFSCSDKITIPQY